MLMIHIIAIVKIIFHLKLYHLRPIITGAIVPFDMTIIIGDGVDILLAINCLMRIALRAIAFAPRINVNGFICEPERILFRQQRPPPPPPLRLNRPIRPVIS